MRKHLSVITLCLVFLALSRPVLAADDNPKVYKLGFMASFTGSFAAVCETQRKGVFLAVDQVNARGGLNMPWGKVKVEVLVKDDETKIDVGVRRFRELMADGMNGMAGVMWNPMMAAINDECKVTPVPLFTCASPALDSFLRGNLAEGTFSVCFTPWSVGYLGGVAMSKMLQKKKIYHLSRTDSWGISIDQGLDYALKDHGGEVIGFSESPLGTTDFTAAIGKAKSLRPDVFYSNFFAKDAIASFKQAYEQGLYRNTTIFNAWITNVVGQGIPEEALTGLYGLTYYYYDLEGFQDKYVAKRAREFTEAHTKKYGEPPDAYAAIAHIAAELLLKGVERAGSFETKKISTAIMKSKDLTCIKGPVYFREDHQMVSKYAAFLVKGKSPAEKKNKWDIFKVEGYYGGESVLPPLRMLAY